MAEHGWRMASVYHCKVIFAGLGISFDVKYQGNYTSTLFNDSAPSTLEVNWYFAYCTVYSPSHYCKLLSKFHQHQHQCSYNSIHHSYLNIPYCQPIFSTRHLTSRLLTVKGRTIGEEEVDLLTASWPVSIKEQRRDSNTTLNSYYIMMARRGVIVIEA